MLYPVIDAHQHFWKYNPIRDAWITDEMQLLQQDFLPPDIDLLFKENHISGSVVVQSDASEMENDFQLDLADQYPFIKGVVGWIDFYTGDVEGKLKYYNQFSRMKGFRHILQSEQQRDLMLEPAFQKGIGLLNKYGFSYDLLILPDQLGYAEKLVAAFPDQRFVIDHLAKPLIKSADLKEWKLAMRKFSAHQHVYCKVSGMVTEADWKYWKPDDFHPYLDTVLETFGTKRLMFGSDWPVCLLAADYDEVKEIAVSYFTSLTETEQADIFGANAVNFYQLT